MRGLDILVIPRGAKHKRQAFEFLAFVQRQDEMEKLCALHCKPSPLVRVSDEFNRNHLNPYIDIFERLDSAKCVCDGQNPHRRRGGGRDESDGRRLALLERTPKQALAEAQERLTAKYADYLQRRAFASPQKGVTPPSRCMSSPIPKPARSRRA